MSEEQQSTAVQIKAWHWPVIVVGLCGYILMQRSDLKELQEKNDALQDARLKDKDELARYSDRLNASLERTISFTNRPVVNSPPDSATADNQSGTNGKEGRAK